MRLVNWVDAARPMFVQIKLALQHAGRRELASSRGRVRRWSIIVPGSKGVERTVTTWDDAITASCDCPGWIYHGGRMWRHIKMINAELAQLAVESGAQARIMSVPVMTRGGDAARKGTVE